jgi:hypothetical protein
VHPAEELCPLLKGLEGIHERGADGSIELACARVVEIFLRTGSHFLSHADWGCLDGDHRAWITVEVSDKTEARNILLPALRADARIIQLNKFTMKDIKDILGHHKP